MAQKTSLTPRAQEMFALIEKYLAGGTSRKEFCKQESITCSTLQWWLGQYRRSNVLTPARTQSPKAFIPVKVTSHKKTSVASYPACIVEYPNGVIIRLIGELDVQVLSQLICIQAD